MAESNPGKPGQTDMEVAVGTPAFTQRFLAVQADKVRELVEMIVEIPTLAGPHQPAVQVAKPPG